MIANVRGEKVMKNYRAVFYCMYIMCMTFELGGKTDTSRGSKAACQKVCVPLARTMCNICDMEDPRASRYPGIRYPRYFQGYPYYGYYLEGSSTGFSWWV